MDGSASCQKGITVKYQNSKTKQEMEVGDWETIKRQVLERSGWKVVDETPTIPPAGALEPQEAPSDEETPKATQLDSNGDYNRSDAPTEAVTKPAEAPKAKPVKKAK